MNKYSKLPDIEINKLVIYAKNGDSSPKDDDVNKQLKHFDPCNNASDAMPIIIENNISIIKNDDSYDAYKNLILVWGDHFYDEVANNKNYLRAAMECFLLIKDAENETNT